MSQSKRLKVLVIIATSFCLFFTINFMASCTETAPPEEVQSGKKILEEEVAEDIAVPETFAVESKVETTDTLEEGATEEVEPAPEALSIASNIGNLEDVEKLIGQGVDVNTKDGYGSTPLSYAAAGGYTEIVELLIDNSADVNARGNNDSTALIVAAAYGHIEIMKLLIDNGAEVDAKYFDGEIEGRTALYPAAFFGQIEALELLIDSGADINNQTNMGGTALTYALHQRTTESVEFLINSGIDLNLKDNNGNTALMLAEAYGFTEIVDLLKRKTCHLFYLARLKSCKEPELLEGFEE